MSSTSGPVVIGGATGRTSGAAIETLLTHNIPVRALVRNVAKATAMLPKSDLLELFELDDLANFEGLKKAYAGARGVYIISPHLADAFRVVSAQVQAAYETDVPNVAFLSTHLTTYPNRNTIGDIHLVCERFLELYELPSYTVLCPDFFYQNHENQKRPILALGQFFYMGETKVPAIDALDIGAMVAQVFIDGPGKHHKQRYMLTCEEDQAKTHVEMVAILSEAIGKPIKAVPLGPEEFKARMAPVFGKFDLKAVSQSRFSQGPDFSAPAATDIRKVLGRKPRSFEEYARDNADRYAA